MICGHERQQFTAAGCLLFLCNGAVQEGESIKGNSSTATAGEDVHELDAYLRRFDTVVFVDGVLEPNKAPRSRFFSNIYTCHVPDAA